MKRPPTKAKPTQLVKGTALRGQAEARLRERQTTNVPPRTEADTQRLVHELQVHQLELEMQNTELQEARDRMETLLEKYTDLYDFAPVGYFSLDEQGRILELNLAGAALLGVDRASLINRSLPRFVTSPSQPTFLSFLKRAFAGAGKQVCEATLRKEDGTLVWASFHGTFALFVSGARKWCRVAVSDITSRKLAEEAQRRAEDLAVANRELKEEIIRRLAEAETLKNREQHQRQLLEQSDRMQEQFRRLSRQILSAQEDERKRISRELHDVIAQTLTGINIRLATLKKEALVNPKGLDRNIGSTQRLVEQSVDIVHQFARELRPTVLDDLGLIPALHSYLKTFTERSGVRTYLTVFAGVEKLDMAGRTVLFRVAQEALTNVARHAQANRVDVDIQKRQGSICMRIRDDGKSFSVEHALTAKGGTRLGLLGMRERVEMVGGKFAVESAPGKGTTIEAQIPLGKVRPDAKSPKKCAVALEAPATKTSSSAGAGKTPRRWHYVG